MRSNPVVATINADTLSPYQRAGKTKRAPKLKTISVKDASKLIKPKEQDGRCFSHWYAEIRGANGKLKFRGLIARGYTHNLTTDTATGYTGRRDWQAKAMGGGTAPTSTYVGVATATSGTTLTIAGTFVTAGQGLAGCIVAVGPNAAGTGSTTWMVITSNTATVLTGDGWHTGSTWATGATTPNATCNYIIIPGQCPAMWMGITSDATAPAATDTILTTEATTNGFARALAAWAHTTQATTYTMTNTFTAAGGGLTIQRAAGFGAANTTAGGVMPFESAVPSPPVLISGDTCQIVQTVTIN